MKTTKRTGRHTQSQSLVKGLSKCSIGRATIATQTALFVGFAIVGIAVALSWFMTPIPIAVGFTVLALLRIGISVREIRREAASQRTERICTAGG